MIRKKLVVVAAIAAASLTASMSAWATTSAHQDVNCGYGDVGSARFTENNTSATWEMWATWKVKRWWGTETKNGAKVTYVAARGTHRVHTESSSKQAPKTLHVQSTGSVEGSAGVQCTETSGCDPTAKPCLAPEAPDSPLDDVFVPAIPMPESPANTDILDRFITGSMPCPPKC